MKIKSDFFRFGLLVSIKWERTTLTFGIRRLPERPRFWGFVESDGEKKYRWRYFTF